MKRNAGAGTGAGKADRQQQMARMAAFVLGLELDKKEGTEFDQAASHLTHRRLANEASMLCAQTARTWIQDSGAMDLLEYVAGLYRERGTPLGAARIRRLKELRVGRLRGHASAVSEEGMVRVLIAGTVENCREYYRLESLQGHLKSAGVSEGTSRENARQLLLKLSRQLGCSVEMSNIVRAAWMWREGRRAGRDDAADRPARELWAALREWQMGGRFAFPRLLSDRELKRAIVAADPHRPEQLTRQGLAAAVVKIADSRRVARPRSQSADDSPNERAVADRLSILLDRENNLRRSGSVARRAGLITPQIEPMQDIVDLKQMLHILRGEPAMSGELIERLRTRLHEWRRSYSDDELIAAVLLARAARWPVTQADVARLMGLAPAQVSKLVDRLVAWLWGKERRFGSAEQLAAALEMRREGVFERMERDQPERLNELRAGAEAMKRAKPR